MSKATPTRSVSEDERLARRTFSGEGIRFPIALRKRMVSRGEWFSCFAGFWTQIFKVHHDSHSFVVR